MAIKGQNEGSSGDKTVQYLELYHCQHPGYYTTVLQDAAIWGKMGKGYMESVQSISFFTPACESMISSKSFFYFLKHITVKCILWSKKSTIDCCDQEELNEDIGLNISQVG